MNKLLNKSDLINIYHDLHQIPELALQENKTAEYIRRQLNLFNQSNLKIYSIKELPTATIVKINGKNPKRNLGYRADIDALAINETNNVPFKSKNLGQMHACGHDIHITVALGLIDYYSKNQPDDNLIFIFQPAEENYAGGMKLYNSNILKKELKINEIYALHTNPDLKVGDIGCKVGTLFAGTTEIHANFKGLSGHAAFPQNANDMVIALSQWVLQLQTIVSRNIDPIKGGVVTIGNVTAGSANNVIAGNASANGTIRALQQDTIELIKNRIIKLTKAIELGFDCKIDLQLNQDGYFPVINEQNITQRFINFVNKKTKFNYVKTPAAMTGEDFGYLINKIPGMMFWLGVDSPGGLHCDNYLANENAIEVGVLTMTEFLNYRMTLEG